MKESKELLRQIEELKKDIQKWRDVTQALTREALYGRLMRENINNPLLPKKLMKDMTQDELSIHLGGQLEFIKKCQTSDTLGAMLVIFEEDNVTQYGATIDPECAPAALRELADRIENRQTIKR